MQWRTYSLLLLLSFGWLAPLLLLAEHAFLLPKEHLLLESNRFLLRIDLEEFNTLVTRGNNQQPTEFKWQGQHWDIVEIRKNPGSQMAEVLCFLDLSEDLIYQITAHHKHSGLRHHSLPFFNCFFIETSDWHFFQPVTHNQYAGYQCFSPSVFSETPFQPPRA